MRLGIAGKGYCMTIREGLRWYFSTVKLILRPAKGLELPLSETRRRIRALRTDTDIESVVWQTKRFLARLEVKK